MDVNVLISKVLDCPTMGYAGGRQSVISGLPKSIQQKILEAPIATSRESVANIVNSCLTFPDGLKALISAIKFFDGGTIACNALEQFVKDNPPDTQSTSDQTVPSTLPATLKILFLSADPSDEARLRVGKEFSDISARIQRAEKRDKFEMSIPQTSLTAENIQFELRNKKPQIVHFSGHGKSDGRLFFETADGKSMPVSVVALERIFGRLKGVVQCVVLNACYSKEQAEAIAKHITYVVGMSEPIADEVALAFANGFYVGLGAGAISDQSDPFEDAFNAGCDQIAFTASEDDVNIPVFYKGGQLVQGSYD